MGYRQRAGNSRLGRRVEPPKKGFRRLIIDGATWRFRVGRWAQYIRIWSPAGKHHLAHGRAVAGLSSDDIERGQWKRTSDGMITPSMIESYIRKNLIDATL